MSIGRSCRPRKAGCRIGRRLRHGKVHFAC
jgi:hypothetical protein